MAVDQTNLTVEKELAELLACTLYDTGLKTQRERWVNVGTNFGIARERTGDGLQLTFKDHRRSRRSRETGRTYRTPINVFLRGDAYFFFLTYGSDAQWAKNVLAAGSCSLETRGRVVELVEPELTDPELRPASPVVRFVERRIAGVTQYLRMHRVFP